MHKLLCAESDVPEGTVRAVAVPGFPTLAVCNVAGAFHVIDDVCSHGASSLSEGSLLGCELECPLHQGRFDVTTGRATRRPAKKPLRAYRCTTNDGQLYLTTDDAEATLADGDAAETVIRHRHLPSRPHP